MMGFALGATLLVGLTLLLLLLPFRRRHDANGAGADFSRRQLNAAIYRDELAELERDRAEGALAPEDFEQARAELQRRLIEDTNEEAVVPAAASAKALPLLLALALPVAAALLYLTLGNPAAVNPPPPEPRFTADDIERMVAGLAARLEKEPENLQGWAMLARSYKAMGRIDEAVRAYERAGALVEGNADLLIDYADTLASHQRGFDQRVATLVDKALKLDPAHPQALWLRGTIAYDAQQYDKAIADWEALLKLLPPGSENANALQANLAEVRELQAKAASGRKK